MGWLDKYEKAQHGRSLISLPTNNNPIIENNLKVAYAGAKGLDNVQLTGFEDQDKSDALWRKNRDTYYGQFRQKWLSEGNNKKFSQSSPEYMAMISDMKKSWFQQNPRQINEIVMDYRENGPKNAPSTTFERNVQFQKGGRIRDERYDAVRARDNTTFDYKIDNKMMTPAQVEAYKKEALKQRIGDIGPEEKQSVLSKIKEIALNPLTAFGYAARNQELPSNFSRGERNPFDYAVDVINPAQYVHDGQNIIEGTVTGNLSQIGEGALGVVPLALEAKNLKKLTKINSKDDFISEIEWGKWNKEIPENKELIDEYFEIEKKTKKDGTWVKNPDGSDFTGTPEQFVQINSSNFKKAYPEGYNEVYRGVGPANNNPDFSQGFKEGDRAIFTADKNLAKEYEWGVLDVIKKQRDNFLTPNSNRNSSGIYQLAHPKGDQIAYNTMGDDWTNINLSKGASKINLEWQLKKQKEHLRELLDTGLNQDAIAFSQERINSLQNYISNFDKMGNNKEAFAKMRQALGDQPSTDEMAAYLENTDLNNITLQNIVDGGLGDVTIVNNKKGKYLKSLRGNNGMFDMNDPNIYKTLIPGAIGSGGLGTAAASQAIPNDSGYRKLKKGGIIEDDRGQWAHPGQITKINSNIITMRGVGYPVLGVSNTGDQKMMFPGNEYQFDGDSVTEFPMIKNRSKKSGGWLDNY